MSPAEEMSPIQKEFIEKTHVHPEHFLGQVLDFLFPARTEDDLGRGRFSTTRFIDGNGDWTGWMKIRNDSIEIRRLK